MSDSRPGPHPIPLPQEERENILPGDDPEIAALLDFEPVPRKVRRPDGWTAKRQREFIRRLALTGSAGTAARQMGKNVSGIEAIYREEGADSFRAAWDAALELAWTREERRRGQGFEGRAPGINVRNAASPHPLSRHGGEGQVMNEFGEWEDEDSLQRRAEEARDSITRKLLNARRLYLQEIAGSPGKRAAFEILTQLPIDWDKAARLEPQADEPWRIPNMRTPEMLLTAENGWLGDMAHGPDKKAELRKALEDYRAEMGLEPVEWDDQQPECPGRSGTDHPERSGGGE